MSYSDEERDFREGMADFDYDDQYNIPGDEHENADDEPATLHGEIKARGDMSSRQHVNDYEYSEMENKRRDMERYGSQNNGQYNMENFIVQVLELKMDSEYVRMMDAGERTDYIIDKAVETINSGPTKEIHFTPDEDTEYKKIKAIYNKLADDLKKMVCKRMGLSHCPHNSDRVIEKSITEFPGVSNRIRPGMTFGFKLKAIEDYFSEETKALAKGRKTRRRRDVSKKKKSGKRRTSGKTKRRRTRSKKM
jgi:hypothetical protein